MVRTAPRGGREGTPERGRNGVPVRRVDAGYRTKGPFLSESMSEAQRPCVGKGFR
jgi:hypothetical protein